MHAATAAGGHSHPLAASEETSMLRNVGKLDQVIRIVVGLGALSLYFVGPKTPWALLGILPLVTAVGGFCPLYGMLGLSTCRTQSRSQS
jgi:hypothetical protein